MLHNPNNWHWVNKDARAWAKEYLSQKVCALSAEDNGASAKIERLAYMDGDVDVNQRKGKVIALFDVTVRLEYQGKTKDGEDVSGNISIPEVAHDTEEDEYVFEIENHGDSLSKQPVKDLVRSKIVPQLRKELATLTPALIQEHGKDLQHAPGTDPSSRTSTPTKEAQALKTEAPAAKSSTTTAAAGKAAVNTKTVTASDEFRTTAEELYTTFTDPQRIAAFTRAPPQQFEGAHVGGKFAIFDGNVKGEYVKLERPALIVQKWRLAQWPEGHFSTLEIKFDQNDVDGVTQMRVTWTGVPVGQEGITKTNWENYYVRSMKQTFGFGTIL